MDAFRGRCGRRYAAEKCYRGMLAVRAICVVLGTPPPRRFVSTRISWELAFLSRCCSQRTMRALDLSATRKLDPPFFLDHQAFSQLADWVEIADRRPLSSSHSPPFRQVSTTSAVFRILPPSVALSTHYFPLIPLVDVTALAAHSACS